MMKIYTSTIIYMSWEAYTKVKWYVYGEWKVNGLNGMDIYIGRSYM